MSWEGLHEGILSEFVEASVYRHSDQDMEEWMERKRYFASAHVASQARCAAKRNQDPARRAAYLAKKCSYNARVRGTR